MRGLSAFFHQLDWAGMTSLLLRAAAVLLCIMIHEVSHALAAYLLGDPTAKAQHRLSLNPLRHIDLFGTLMMLVVGFGWARPVPVDARYFKKPKTGMAVTALAGPVSNFLLAYIALVAGYLTIDLMWAGALSLGTARAVTDFCYMVASLSIGLGVFNLIPFPPLDGSKVLGVFLPDALYYKMLRYESAGMFVLMALLWLGVLDGPLFAVRGWAAGLLDALAQWPLALIG